MSTTSSSGSSESPDRPWQAALVGQVVLHREALVIGRVSRFYSGEPDDRVVAPDGRPVCGPVLALDSGHTFVAQEAAKFVPLTRSGAAFHGFLRTGLGGFLQEAALVASKAIASDEFKAIVVAALTEQARELSR